MRRDTEPLILSPCRTQQCTATRVAALTLESQDICDDQGESEREKESMRARNACCGDGDVSGRTHRRACSG